MFIILLIYKRPTFRYNPESPKWQPPSGNRERRIMCIAPVSSWSGKNTDGLAGTVPILLGENWTVPFDAAIRTPSREQIEMIQRQNAILETASAEEILAWAVDSIFPASPWPPAWGRKAASSSPCSRRSSRGCTSSIWTPAISFARRSNCAIGSPTSTAWSSILQTAGAVGRGVRGGRTAGRSTGPIPTAAASTARWRCCTGWRQDTTPGPPGIRRDQGPTRADTPIVRWDKKFGLVKISPLATWTKNDVWKRILDEEIPYNPLHDQGYPSIGCWPCTRPVHAGRGRAGRPMERHGQDRVRPAHLGRLTVRHVCAAIEDRPGVENRAPVG